jgi:hypothetical protein
MELERHVVVGVDACRRNNIDVDLFVDVAESGMYRPSPITVGSTMVSMPRDFRSAASALRRRCAPAHPIGPGTREVLPELGAEYENMLMHEDPA